MATKVWLARYYHITYGNLFSLNSIESSWKLFDTYLTYCPCVFHSFYLGPNHSSIFRNADAIVVVYRLASRQSFRQASEYLRLIRHFSPGTRRLVTLVGTGNDDSGHRVITKEEGRALAMEFHCRWAETSSLTGRMVRKVFLRLARCLLQREIGQARAIWHTDLIHDKRASAEYVGEV